MKEKPNFTKEELMVLHRSALEEIKELEKKEKLESYEIDHLEFLKDVAQDHLKQGKELAECLIKDAKDGYDYISIRDYCRLYEKPSTLLRLLKPFYEELDKKIKSFGYVRVGKGTWRKFDISELEKWNKNKEELAKLLNVDEDSAYVVYVAYRLIKITHPFVKDWKGFNIVHAFSFRDRLYKDKLSMEDIDWMNQRLLNYEEQIKMLNLDFDKIKKRWEQRNELKLDL